MSIVERVDRFNIRDMHSWTPRWTGRLLLRARLQPQAKVKTEPGYLPSKSKKAIGVHYISAFNMQPVYAHAALAQFRRILQLKTAQTKQSYSIYFCCCSFHELGHLAYFNSQSTSETLNQFRHFGRIPSKGDQPIAKRDSDPWPPVFERSNTYAP
jgi:hypothetical protein